MKLQILKGSTSVTLYLFIQNNSVTTGAGLTGLAFNTASLTAYYVRPLGSATSITLATQTVGGAWSSGGFVEVDATNMPGFYRFDIPDACLATGVNSVALLFKGATNMAPLPIEIELVAYNPQDSVRMGLTAMPNAAAAASGGLIINGANTGTVTLAALTCTGTFTISDGLSIARSSANQSAIVATGNGTGHGAIFTSGSGATGNGITLAAASTNGHGLKSTGAGTGDGAELTAGASGVALDAATATMAITGNITGNLSGSVGSVTGAVGSVTGNVGGNVTGSVGSVVGNVGGDVVGSVASVTAAVTVGTVNANAIATASFQAGAITAAVTDSTFDNSIADALLDRSNGIEAGVTPRQAWRASAAALAGVLSGAATTTVNINEIGGTSFTRISATVDADGNRSAIVLSL